MFRPVSAPSRETAAKTIKIAVRLELFDNIIIVLSPWSLRRSSAGAGARVRAGADGDYIIVIIVVVCNNNIIFYNARSLFRSFRRSGTLRSAPAQKFLRPTPRSAPSHRQRNPFARPCTFAIDRGAVVIIVSTRPRHASDNGATARKHYDYMCDVHIYMYERTLRNIIRETVAVIFCPCVIL